MSIASTPDYEAFGSVISDIWLQLDKMNGHLGMIAEYLRVIAEKD